MGKIKRHNKEKRKQGNRLAIDPIGIPSFVQSQQMVGLENEHSMLNPDAEQDNVPHIIKQLTSSNDADREQACVSLASIVLRDDNESDEELLKKLKLLESSGGVKLLCEKLVDPSKLVRLAAAGALRNLIASGGSDISNVLVQCEISTPLLTAFQQSLESYLNPNEEEQAKKDNHDTLIQLLFVMSFLCENSDIATKKISSFPPILNLFLLLLTTKDNSAELLNSAAQCLTVISDENQTIQTLFYKTPNAIAALMSQLNEERRNRYYRVYIAAIALNICQQQDFLKVGEQVMGVLLLAIDYDPLPLLLQLVPDLEKDEESLLYQEWKNCCNAQRTSFELIANIASMLAFPQGDEQGMADFEDDNEDLQADDSVRILESQRPEFIHFVSKSNIISKLFDICNKLAKQPNPLIVSSEHASNELPIVHQSLLRCLNCLNNILVASSVSMLQQFDMKGFWVFINEQCMQTTGTLLQRVQQSPISKEQVTIQVETIATFTSIILMLMKKPFDQHMFPIPPAHAQLYAQLCTVQQSEEIRVNCVGIMGEMGKRPHSLEQNKALANMLVQRLSDPSLAVVSEVLNAFFDVYSDVTYNQVLLELNIIAGLQNFLNLLTQRLNREKNTLSQELLAQIKEAKLNLTRFIKYKRQEMK